MTLRMPTTGDRIKQIRDSKNLTQEQLADSSGISKSFLSDVENNNKNISSQALLRIANTLGASVDYLLSGEVKEFVKVEPVMIPSELDKAAVELKLSYSETLELLTAHDSVVAKRSNRTQKKFTVEDWKNLYKAIREVFG